MATSRAPLQWKCKLWSASPLLNETSNTSTSCSRKRPTIIGGHFFCAYLRMQKKDCGRQKNKRKKGLGERIPRETNNRIFTAETGFHIRGMRLQIGAMHLQPEPLPTLTEGEQLGLRQVSHLTVVARKSANPHVCNGMDIQIATMPFGSLGIARPRHHLSSRGLDCGHRATLNALIALRSAVLPGSSWRVS